MQQPKPEYLTQRDAIRDARRGTYVGMMIVVLLLLLLRELLFASTYVGSGGLLQMSLKIAVVITFTVYWFFIHEGRGDGLQKVRNTLLLFLVVAVTVGWIVSLSNRAFPASLPSSQETAIVRIATKGDGTPPDHVTLYLQMTDGDILTSEVAKPEQTSRLRVPYEQRADFAAGTLVEVRRIHGRWGQDFITWP